jgi:sugar lactone lactonase YvrE
MEFDVLIHGLKLPESPRWHDDCLWFSDLVARTVGRLTSDGKHEVICEVPTRPSGLGWDTHGRPLIVSQMDARLLRLEDGQLAEVSDHGSLVYQDSQAQGDILTNDMVVDSFGRAYIGTVSSSHSRPTPLVRIDEDGKSVVVAADLRVPNGTVITADGKTLIVAESYGDRLTAFGITESGDLVGERSFATDFGKMPDGICLDEEGAVWVACVMSREIVRVFDGGDVAARIPMNRIPLACMLGGSDRRTLFVATVEQIDQSGDTATGRYEATRVDVPGAGLP